MDRTKEKFDIATCESGWFFDGVTFYQSPVYLPKGDDISAWQEVTEAFKEQWEAEHQPEE